MTNHDHTGILPPNANGSGILASGQCFAPDLSQLSPDAVIENTMFVDITDDRFWMPRANRLAAEGYAPLTNPALGLGVEDLLATLSLDAFEEQGRARTIGALTTHPDTGVTEITGRARVVIGDILHDNGAIPPIEAMTFVEPLHGWPHAGSSQPIDRVGEISRVVIVATCRTLPMQRAGVPALFIRRFYEECVSIMRIRRAGMLYAIMPPYLVRLVNQAGVRVRLIDSRFRTEDSVAACTFNTPLRSSTSFPMRLRPR